MSKPIKPLTVSPKLTIHTLMRGCYGRPEVSGRNLEIIVERLNEVIKVLNVITEDSRKGERRP